MRALLCSSLLALAVMSPGIAFAQSSDVIVMRKPVVEPGRVQPGNGNGGQPGGETPGGGNGGGSQRTYSWTVGEWSPPPPSCSNSVTVTRSVQCRDDLGAVTADDRCSDARPEATMQTEDLSACSYAWRADPWSDWSSSCSVTAKRTRDVFCERSGGDTQPTSVADLHCTGERPDHEEESEIRSGCVHSCQPWRYNASVSGASYTSKNISGPSRDARLAAAAQYCVEQKAEACQYDDDRGFVLAYQGPGDWVGAANTANHGRYSTACSDAP